MKYLLIFFLIFFRGVVEAQDFTAQAHSKAHFVSEFENLKPGINWLGLWVELEPKWHTYWLNPGDSASPPFFQFSLPEGLTWVATHFPTPKRIPFGPLQSFGYENEVLFLFEIRVDAIEASDAPLPIQLEAEWLVCKEACIPGVFNFKIERNFSNQKPVPTLHLKKFESFKKKLPRTFSQPADLVEEKGLLKLTLPKSLWEQKPLDILPFSNQVVNNLAPTLRDGMAYFQTSDLSASSEKPPMFLVLTEQGSVQLQAEAQTNSLLMMALFAFIGGLILNLMPCVFPILALKVYLFAKNTELRPAEVFSSSLWYSLGILVSFWTLAALTLILRESGTLLGWGFQMQSPGFVFFLICLFLMMGFFFLDWVPLSFGQFAGMGQKLTQKEGALGSFFTGALAVIVASPCTAPFMGAALGYAMTQSPTSIILIFSALGLGLASPFLFFSIFPKLFAWLPKPGAWMERFKKLMAIPMFLTALWLASVLYIQVSQPAGSQGSTDWIPFSEEALLDAKKSGRPIFVNFTASWCISCQFNDRLVFRDEAVRESLKKKKFIMMKADWTKKDRSLGNVLKKYGRAGVPLYLYFAPKSQQPDILPEILTVDLFLSRVGLLDPTKKKEVSP